MQELDYTVIAQITKITIQSSTVWHFKSATANKLPVVTKIYNTDSGVLIAVVEGEEIPYLAMYEG